MNPRLEAQERLKTESERYEYLIRTKASDISIQRQKQLVDRLKIESGEHTKI